MNLTNILLKTFYGLSLPSEKMSIEIKSVSLIGCKFPTFLHNSGVIPSLRTHILDVVLDCCLPSVNPGVIPWPVEFMAELSIGRLGCSCE